MKKNYQKLLCALLIAMLILSVFTACSTPVHSDSTLNGIALSDFSIVYAEDPYGYNTRAAQYIQAEIRSRTGLNLPVIKDSDAAAGNSEIVVGDTSRAISSQLEPVSGKMQFTILAEDSRIALEGEYFVIAAAAYYFVQTYIPENNYHAEIPKEVTTLDPIAEQPDHYIMLIGDGMGVNQTRLFDVMQNNRDYSHGETAFFGYYLPYAGFSRTDSLTGTTDSAAGGTALACGIKTINYYVGQDQNHDPVQSLTELAGSRGMATAVMSTETMTGATPSAFSAHADDREDKSDIIISQSELQKQYGTIIDCGYDIYTYNGVAKICDKVRKTLDTLGQDPDGFFMMYEEAHIDKHCHNNDIDSTFNAVTRFNRVIGVVMEWVFYHPNTLVLITADHETGGLTDQDGSFVYTSEEHTSADVPVFAYGVGGELFHGTVVENIQIPMTIASLWGVHDFGDQSNFQPLTK